MSNAVVKWIGGKQFVGIDSTNHSVVLSTPDEGVGMKPSELLLVALAACTAVDVVEILAKKRLDLQHLEISAEGQQDQDRRGLFVRFTCLIASKVRTLTRKTFDRPLIFPRKNIVQSQPL